MMSFEKGYYSMVSAAIYTKNKAIRLWERIGSGKTATMIALITGLVSYVFYYLKYDAVPGNHPTYPLGWMGWADQGHYLDAAKDFAAGSLTASQQSYPPLYPLVGALFYPIFKLHLFLVPNLLLLFVYIWLFMQLFSRYVGPQLALFALLIGFFQSKILPLQWVIPWTSSLSAVFIMGALLLYDRYLRLREGPMWSPKSQIINAGAVGLMIGLLAPTRPGDFLMMSPVLVFYGLSVLRFGLKGTGSDRTLAAMTVLLGGILSVFPVVLYLAFNHMLFGSMLSGYFDHVANGGGSVPALLFDHAYGHLINADTLFGEADADWVTRLPMSYVALCVIPFAMLFGPTLIRLVSLIILVHLTLIYSYADAVPTGQFRYFNIHYMKWFLPILPVIVLYFMREAVFCRSKLARRSTYALLGGSALLLLTQAITPSFQKIVPDSIKVESATRMTLQFKRPEIINYIEVPGIYGVIGGFPLRGQKIRVNGENLIPVRDMRPTPTDHGMRFLFSKPMAVRSAEIEVNGFDDLSKHWQHGTIGVRVHYDWSLPWFKDKPSNPLPGAPSVMIGRKFQVGQGHDGIFYLGSGWSHQESWGNWMDGKNATMDFTLPYETSGGIRVSIEGQGFVVPGRQPEVIVDVIFNEVKLGEMHFTSSSVKTFEFALPEATFEGNEAVHLNFISHTTISPEEAGMSDDVRQLSFGIIGFKFFAGNTETGK